MSDQEFKFSTVSALPNLKKGDTIINNEGNEEQVVAFSMVALTMTANGRYKIYPTTGSSGVLAPRGAAETEEQAIEAFKVASAMEAIHVNDPKKAAKMVLQTITNIPPDLLDKLLKDGDL